jgi:hypothetical protein
MQQLLDSYILTHVSRCILAHTWTLYLDIIKSLDMNENKYVVVCTIWNYKP